MKIEEIVETLRDFGLNDYEARTYSTLVFLGPSKAGKLSRESRVPQSKIYEVLDSLMAMQLVEVFDSRPKEYKAIDPGVALENLVRIEEKKVKILKAKATGVKTVLKKVNGNGEETMEGIWTVKSRKYAEFFEKVSEALDRSESYVYAISRDFSKTARLSQALIGCLKRGVKVKVVAIEPVTQDNYWKAKWYQSHGIQLKFFETKMHPRIVVIDGREIVMRLDHDPIKKENFLFTAMWSSNPSLVNVIDSYMKDLWAKAEPINFSDLKKTSFTPNSQG